MASINQLPNELIMYIFEYLDLKSRLNCRLVRIMCNNEVLNGLTKWKFPQISLKWKCAIDNVRIKQLVYSFTPVDDFVCRPWYLTKEIIDPGNVIEMTAVSKMKLCPFSLMHLERLRIDVAHQQIDWNEFLADFPKLRHLEIFWIDKSFLVKGNRLQLPASLKTFRIVFAADHLVPELKLNAPHLENVLIKGGISSIEFSHPESIKHLEVGASDSHYISKKMQVYPNIEYFSCGYSLDKNWDLFKFLPNVKEIHLNVCIRPKSKYYIDKLEGVINAVTARKKLEGRTDVNIFCNGKKTVENRPLRMHLRNV